MPRTRTLICLLLISLICSPLNIHSAEPRWYPKYHLAPPKGWLGLPCGLSFFKGYYHAFYQFYPENAGSSLTHWGHARSKDMVQWEHLPIALAPSLPDDIGGLLSGSAVVLDDNLTIIYTGASSQNKHQTQILATSKDGITFDKLGVVLRKEGDDSYFRDPKAWEEDGKWFIVLGYRNQDGISEVLLYKSKDLSNWTTQGFLAKANDTLGFRWECPDFFTLGGKQFLMVSLQGIQQECFDYLNPYQVGYFVGSWSPGESYQTETGIQEIDHGHDFYAPQTFLAPDGRRIILAWLGMWGSTFPENKTGWANMLTLPRELTLSASGDLQIKPIKELKSLRKKKPVVIKALQIKKGEVLMVDDKIFRREIIAKFDLTASDARVFGIHFGKLNTEEGVKTFVNRTESRLFLKRYYPKYGLPATRRSIPLDLSQSSITLNIFIDGSSIEVFVNNGQAAMTSRIYPENNERHAHAFALEGAALLSNFYSWEL